MVHEHVRDDRDDHVVYICRNVQGYSAALTKVMASENLAEEEAHRLLCEDRTFAEKHAFIGSHFTKNPQCKLYDEPGGFDMDSIISMYIYASDVFADPAYWTEARKCPLLKLVRVNGEVVGKNRILGNKEPSLGDVTWVKMWHASSGDGPGRS